MGSGDASTRCRHNWYLSGRGTYHVLMAFFQAESLGPIGARLSEVLFSFRLVTTYNLSTNTIAGITVPRLPVVTSRPHVCQ